MARVKRLASGLFVCCALVLPSCAWLGLPSFEVQTQVSQAGPSKDAPEDEVMMDIHQEIEQLNTPPGEDPQAGSFSTLPEDKPASFLAAQDADKEVKQEPAADKEPPRRQGNPRPTPAQQAAAIKMLQAQMQEERRTPAKNTPASSPAAGTARKTAGAKPYTPPAHATGTPYSPPTPMRTPYPPAVDQGAARQHGLRDLSLPKTLPMDMDGKIHTSSSSPL